MTEPATEHPPESSRLKLRYEWWLLGLFSVVWLAVFSVYSGLVPLMGTFSLDLYRFYSVAAVLGWVAGNVYMLRRAILPKGRFTKRLLLAYWIGPASIVFLIRSLASTADHAAAPFVPLYGACVFSLFFLVPVTLKATRTPRIR